MIKKLIHRKETIIVSTIEVLDRVGIQNLSTKLIAEQEGVSEGTLFRHFKNKDEILSAVIDHYSQFDDAIIKTCRKQALTAIDSIHYFFNAYGEYYENYPEITVINQIYGALMYEKALLGKIEINIEKRENFLIELIDQAKVEKSILSEVDTIVLAGIILDATTGIILKWRWKDYSFSVKEKIKEIVEILIQL